MTKIYRSDEDKMMQDRNLKWSSSSIMKHKPEDENSIQGFLAVGQLQERFLIKDIATGHSAGQRVYPKYIKVHFPLKISLSSAISFDVRI